MGIKLTSTSNQSDQFLKILVYGQAGSGKTRLAATLSNPVIISAEAGLLSLRDHKIAAVEVKSVSDLEEIYGRLRDAEDPDFGGFDWVVLDSITEIAEQVLAKEKELVSDNRQAYGNLATHVTGLIKAFRDLPRNVYMSAKCARIKDDATGAMHYGVDMPGSKLGPAVPYLFDEVFALLTHRNEDGDVLARLQTNRTPEYEAKDRSGALDDYELPDLGAIARKILPQKEMEAE